MDSGDLEFPLTAIPKMKRGEHSRYVPNHRSFGAFMRSEQMRDPTAEAAGDIADIAASFIPPSSGGEDSTGLHDRVKAGFKVKRNGGLLKVAGNRRVQVLVENKAEGAALLEFGAKNLPRRRMLMWAAKTIPGADFKKWRTEGA